MNRIKEVLTEKGKTTKWLSEQVGKSACTVGQWCNNKSQPKPEMLEKIANLLEVNYTELVGAQH